LDRFLDGRRDVRSGLTIARMAIRLGAGGRTSVRRYSFCSRRGQRGPGQNRVAAQNCGLGSRSRPIRVLFTRRLYRGFDLLHWVTSPVAPHDLSCRSSALTAGWHEGGRDVRARPFGDASAGARGRDHYLSLLLTQMVIIDMARWRSRHVWPRSGSDWNRAFRSLVNGPMG